MPDSKFFGVPFGTSGDKATIPEATQPSGAISYQQGFGPDYERDPGTDPLAKRVPRDETNELYFQATNAIKFLQLYGLPEWYDVDDTGADVSYPIIARVRHNNLAWVSLVANNTAEPGTDGTKWALWSTPTPTDSDFPAAGFQAAPPGSPVIGSKYVVASGATGAWAGQDNKIAVWSGSWAFVTAVPGLVATFWNGSRLLAIRYDGTSWAEWLASNTAAGPVRLATDTEVSNASAVLAAVLPGQLGRGAAKGRVQYLTSAGSGVFTVPDGVYALNLLLVGGGGGGAYGAPGVSGNAGAAGGTAIKRIAVTPGQTLGWTVGGSGNPGTVSTPPTTGGTTSFGGVVSATGGANGTTGPQANSPGGIGVGGDVNLSGGVGQTWFETATGFIAGGAGGEAKQPFPCGQFFGINFAGEPGKTFGNGGGGGSNGQPGGSGFNGLIIVEY